MKVEIFIQLFVSVNKVFMPFLTLYIVTAFEPYYIRVGENNYSYNLCLIS